MINENFKGHLAAISANIIFGLNISISKEIFAASWMTPFGLTITRVTCSLVMFWIISLFIPREKVAPKDILIIGAAGFIGVAVAQTAFTFALRLISPVTMSLIASLSPIIVLLLSALLSVESITIIKAIGVIVGISGAALVILQPGIDSTSSIGFLGIALAFLSVTSFSAHLLIIRKMARYFTPITTMKWMYLWVFVFLSPFGLPELPQQRLFSSEAYLLPFLWLGYTVVFSSIIAFFLMPLALKRIKATTVSMYNNIQPIAASTAAIIVGQDVFSCDKPLALILIVTGVFLVTRRETVTRIKIL